jgi:outer membrane protein assembly factor BamB
MLRLPPFFLCLLSLLLFFRQLSGASPQPLLMITSLNDPNSAAAAQGSIFVTDGQAFLACDNNAVYAISTSSGFPSTSERFKFVPESDGNITSMFFVDGDASRVGVIGTNYVVLFHTHPAVGPDFSIYLSNPGEVFQNAHRPLTAAGVVYFGTGCDWPSNGCKGGQSFVLALNASAGRVLWNVSTTPPDTPVAPNTSSCANYPMVRFPGWTDVIVVLHDACGDGSQPAEVLLLNASTGAAINRLQLDMTLGFVLWVAPVDASAGGVLVLQGGGASLLSSPSSSGFRFVARFNEWCFAAVPPTTTIPVTVGHFAVLACNNSFVLVDLSRGTINNTVPTVSDDAVYFMLPVPTLPHLMEAVQAPSCFNCGGASDFLVLAMSLVGDLYVIDAAASVVLMLPSPNVSVVQSQGLTLLYTQRSGPLLLRALQGMGLGMVDGFAFPLANTSSTQTISSLDFAEAFSQTPRVIMSSMIMPVGAAMYDPSTNQIFIANSEPYNIISGFDFTVSPTDAWISPTINDSTPISLNCIGYDFSADLVFYATAMALYAVNGSNGDATRLALLPEPPANRGIVFVGGRYVCTSTARFLVCADIRFPGQVPWSPTLCSPITFIHNEIVAQGDLVVSFCEGGSALAVAFNPSLQETISFGSGRFGFRPGVVSDGVLFGVTQHELFAFELSSGTLLWNTSLHESAIISNAFVLGDYVYVATIAPEANTSLSQFNRASGILKGISYGVKESDVRADTAAYVIGASGGLYGDGLLLMVHNRSVTLFDTHVGFFSTWVLEKHSQTNLSLPAKPMLTTSGVYLHFAARSYAAFNVFGFSFLWGSVYDAQSNTTQQLELIPCVYGGLVFISKEAYVAVAEITTSIERMSVTYIDYLTLEITPVHAILVSTTLTNLTRVLFSQGPALFSMVTTLYEAPEKVTVDCTTFHDLAACNAARPNDYVQCMWCESGAYCTSETNKCTPPRQCLLPLVSWANSPTTSTMSVVVLPSGYAVTASVHYVVVLPTVSTMSSILQLGHLIPLFSEQDLRHNLFGGIAVGSHHVALVVGPGIVFVANLMTMQMQNVSLEKVNLTIVAFSEAPVARYVMVVACDFTNGSQAPVEKACSMLIVDCLSDTLHSSSVVLPRLRNVENTTRAAVLSFATFALNESMFAVRGIEGSTGLDLFRCAPNFSTIEVFPIEIAHPLPEEPLLLLRIDNGATEEVDFHATIQSVRGLCVVNFLRNGSFESFNVLMPTNASLNVPLVTGQNTLFAAFGSMLLIMKFMNSSGFYELEMPAGVVILDMLWVDDAGQSALFLAGDNNKLYVFDFASNTLNMAFAFGQVPQNNELIGLTFFPEQNVLATTFQHNIIGASIQNATKLLPAWAVAVSDDLLGRVKQDAVTGYLFVATDGVYNILGYDPNVTEQGWIEYLSDVFDVANYGIHFSSSNDLFVLLGTTVLNLDLETGVSDSALMLQTTVSGESLAAFSKSLVCASDSYVTQCSTVVNGGQCARCSPPTSLFSATIAYEGLTYTFCGDANSSFLAVDATSMEARFVGHERSIFPGVVDLGMVYAVTESAVSGFSAFPPFSLVWSRGPADGFRFCSNVIRTGTMSVTAGQCSKTNNSMYAEVWLGSSGTVDMALFWAGRNQRFGNPITRAFVAAASGGVLGDGLVAVLTENALLLLGVNGEILMEKGISEGEVLWNAKNLLTLTPEGFLLVDGMSFTVYNVFTSAVVLSEFRYNVSLVPPLLMGSTVVWSTGALLVATDLLTGQCYGQVGYPVANSPVSAVAMDSTNSTRLVIGQSSFVVLVDMSFVNLDPLPPLVPECKPFLTQADCVAGRGNITIGCQWCERLGYCTEGNNICLEDCNFWTPALADRCMAATHCAFCSDYSVCVNAPSCQCSLILGSEHCGETNGMCVYSSGLCRVGACFSFIERGFNSLPFVLFLLGLVKDVLTLAFVGAIEPYTARWIAKFKRIGRRFGRQKTMRGSGSDLSLSESMCQPTEAAKTRTDVKVVYLDGKFTVTRLAQEPLSLESYAALLIDTAFRWPSLSSLTAPSTLHLSRSGAKDAVPLETSEALRRELHTALLLHMLQSSVWITPRALQTALSPLSGPASNASVVSGTEIPACTAEVLKEVLDRSADYFQPAVYISSSRFSSRVIHCISDNATLIQLVYYLTTSLALVGLTAVEVWALKTDDVIKADDATTEASLRFQLVGFRFMNSSTIGTIALLAVKYVISCVKQYKFNKSGKRWGLLRASALLQMSRFGSSKVFHGLYWLYFATALPFVLAGSLLGAALYPFLPAGVTVFYLIFLYFRHHVALRFLQRSSVIQSHFGPPSFRRASAAPTKVSAASEQLPLRGPESPESDADPISMRDKSLNADCEEASFERSTEPLEEDLYVDNEDDVGGDEVLEQPPLNENINERDTEQKSQRRHSYREDSADGYAQLDDVTVDSVRDLHSHRNLPTAERRSRRIAYAKEEARVGLVALLHFLFAVELPTILLAATLQCCFNYSVLYNHRTFFAVDYWAVPGMDYNSRSFECFKQSIVSLFDSAEMSLGHCAQLLTAVVPFA